MLPRLFQTPSNKRRNQRVQVPFLQVLRRCLSPKHIKCYYLDPFGEQAPHCGENRPVTGARFKRESHPKHAWHCGESTIQASNVGALIITNRFWGFLIIFIYSMTCTQTLFCVIIKAPTLWAPKICTALWLPTSEIPKPCRAGDHAGVEPRSLI